VGRPDGTRVVRGEVRGPVEHARQLGESLADDLLSRGAADILRDFARRAEARES
jgi:hydroxymethylbilane synthase